MATQRTRTKVFEAVVALAGEQQVGSITMEGLAQRAGVSKQTLYRTWSSTGEVLFEALLARSTNDEGAVLVPDTGDLADDLTVLGLGMVAELTDPTHEPLLRAVAAEIQSNEGLAEEFRSALLSPQLSAIADRLRTAGLPQADDVAELFVGAIFHRWLLRTRPFETDWLTAHVTRTLKAVESTAHKPR